MREKRALAGYTQGSLAKELDTSQEVISRIESGIIKSSALIYAICDKLAIAPPFMPIHSELERQWLELGQELLARDAELFVNRLEEVRLILRRIAPPA
jgi:transcriptional regulator with XRE-family HTH domain